MTDRERIERARRAKLALDEFLTPALASIEADYAEKMVTAAASVDPRAPEVIARLANGVKVVRQVRVLIEAHVADGAVAQAAMDTARRMDELSEPKRRLVQIGR